MTRRPTRTDPFLLALKKYEQEKRQRPSASVAKPPKPANADPALEDRLLWARVAATVQPRPGRAQPRLPAEAIAALRPEADRPATVAALEEAARVRRNDPPPQIIEPGRQRRISHGRDAIEARIDLHGMTHDVARTALGLFLTNAWNEGRRAVLVITGKGRYGEGVLRRQLPEWLATGNLRVMVAGLSEAHRRHGGEGAFYIALRRKPSQP